MNIFAITIDGALVLLFLVTGLLFSRGKAAFLIAGYNTMSDEDKERFDETALCKFMGKVMFALSFGPALWLASEISGLTLFFYAGLALFFAAVIFAVIFANTSNRFKK